jgi:hypothetical protein
MKPILLLVAAPAVLLAAAVEGVSETTILDIAVSVMGLILIPLWLQGRENKRHALEAGAAAARAAEEAKTRSHALEVKAAEERGIAKAQWDQMVKSIAAFHRRGDEHEATMETVIRVLIAKGQLPPEITAGRTRSRPPLDEDAS